METVEVITRFQRGGEAQFSFDGGETFITLEELTALVTKQEQVPKDKPWAK